MPQPAIYDILRSEIVPKLQRKFDIVLHDESVNTHDTNAEYGERDFFYTHDSGENILVRQYANSRVIMIEALGLSIDNRPLDKECEGRMEGVIIKLLEKKL